MKVRVRKNIQISLLWVLVLLSSLNMLAQPIVITPGDKNISAELLHTGKFVWDYNGGFSFEKAEKPNERFITVTRTSKEITIEERLTKNGIDIEKKKMILSAKTLEPIHSTFAGEEVAYDLQFGAKLKGEATNYKRGDKMNYNEPITEKYFDEASIEYLVSCLPLKPGYKAFIPVGKFDRAYKNLFRVQITDVSEKKSFSCLSGTLDIYVVLLKADSYEKIIHIDKNSKRIVHSEDLSSPYTKFYFTDKEVHLNPIKTKFDVKEAKAMISQGTSSITGQAFTTDENMPKGILQRRKKIIAPKGSVVMLIPNTPYLKEWMDFNATIRKKYPPEYIAGQLYKGCHGYPLPVEVKEQTLLTEVTDSKGSFAFTNLKPGEYHVLVQFVATKYTNTTRTATGTYDITINPDGSGSATQNVDVRHWGSPTEVTNYSLVKIAKDGETVKVKLGN